MKERTKEELLERQENQRCRCGLPSEDEHTCPFAEDIRGDSSLCNCCNECTLQCVLDI